MAEANYALSGVRVLDLTWVMAGPICTRLLADQGAEVIKMESSNSMDPIRMGGPWLNGENTAPEGGGGFTLFNRGKKSATLNLKHPDGKALFERLVKVCDVVVNNYSAGALEKFGLGYPRLQEVNPRIIVAELSGTGQTGPYKSFVGYGQTLMALAGAYEMAGEPDGPPMMPGYTYADFAAATMGAMCITAALRWREVSGVGQYLDLGQYQLAASLTSEFQLEALVNGEESSRTGNYEPGAFVHGVFACAGEDEWCTIVVRTDDDYAALNRVLGGTLPANPPIVGSQESADVAATIEAWTSQRDGLDVMNTLQQVGVEAAKVQNARDLLERDPHIAERGYFETFDHLLGEKVRIDGIPFKMHGTPGRHPSQSPIYGIDNEYVFGELVGLTRDELDGYIAAGVIA